MKKFFIFMKKFFILLQKIPKKVKRVVYVQFFSKMVENSSVSINLFLKNCKKVVFGWIFLKDLPKTTTLHRKFMKRKTSCYFISDS